MNNIIDKLNNLDHINLSLCMQCISCTNGCPFVHIMEHPPHQIIRFLQLGFMDKALSSNTPWICVGCNTCSYNCPMAIDISLIFDVIKEHVIKNKLPIPEPSIFEFHKQVLNSIKKYGRVHKLEVMFNFKLKSKDLFSDITIGLKMFFKKKLHLRPPNFDSIEQLKEIFESIKYEK